MAAQKLVLSDVVSGEFGSKRYVYVAHNQNRVNHVQILLTPAEFSRRDNPGFLWVDLDAIEPEEDGIDHSAGEGG